MSLSDWDVAALDDRGRACNGVSDASSAGVVVSPHEDRLRLSCEALWRPESCLPQPDVAELRDGELTLYDCRVVCRRHPRGAFWATWFIDGVEVRAVAGVVAAGFDGAGYVGVTPEDVRGLARFLAEGSADGLLPPILGTLRPSGLLRFNQGDAYFARHLRHALQSTEIGAAKTPLLYVNRDAAERREAEDRRRRSPQAVVPTLPVAAVAAPAPAAPRRRSKAKKKPVRKPSGKKSAKRTAYAGIKPGQGDAVPLG